MASASKVMTGARAIVRINQQIVAAFANCSWAVRQPKEAIFILGAYAPVELTPTSQEAISMTLTGFRVINASNDGGSPYSTVNQMEKLQNLLNDHDFQVSITDRQSGKVLANVTGCKIVSQSSGAAARGITDLRLEVMGLLYQDESGDQYQDSSSTAGNFAGL